MTDDIGTSNGDDAAITFYWRPGCGFCSRLERALDRSGVTVDRHNIWESPTAAAAVRAVANGNETVPTLLIGPVALVNPSPDAVIAAARLHAPLSLPPELRTA